MSEVNDEDFHTNVDEILAELQAEGNEVEGKTTTPQEETHEEAPSQQEPEAPVTTEEPIEEPQVVNRVPKEPTLIPAWKAKIAEERLEKENEILRQQLEALQRNPTQENREQVQDSVANIRELASQHGLELNDQQEQFFNALVQRNSVPQDLLQNMQALQQQKEIDYLETQYNEEFSKDVAPLLKERYGDLPEKQLATLRQKLHDVAFTEAYAKVPLKKIFLAESEDLAIKPSKEHIVTNKSGKTRGTELDFSSVDEDTFKALDGDSLDKFIEAKSGQSKWSRK